MPRQGSFLFRPQGSILFCPKGSVPRAPRGQTHAPFPVCKHWIKFLSSIIGSHPRIPAISQYEKLFWQTKTSCENILSILSFRGWLLQYTFALSTLLVHLRNKKPLENQSIIKGLECPEQDSNLHASRHAHLKRARLPFRHLGIAFWLCKVTIFFLSNKHSWKIFNDLFGKEQLGRTNWVNSEGLTWEVPPD